MKKTKFRAWKGSLTLVFIYLLFNVIFMFWIIYLSDYFTLDNYQELLSILMPSIFLGFVFGVFTTHFIFEKLSSNSEKNQKGEVEE